jgi:hypothetical protein
MSFGLRLIQNADGALEPLTSGSTRPVALTVTHAGTCKVMRYGFTLQP